MSKLRSKTFFNDTYGVCFTVYLGGTAQEAIDSWRKRMGLKPCEIQSPGYHALTFTNEAVGSVAHWFSKKPTPQVLAHEILHGVVHVLNWIGLPLSEQGDEAYCYLLQSIMERVLKWMRSVK